jgi:hypothetical protein
MRAVDFLLEVPNSGEGNSGQMILIPILNWTLCRVRWHDATRWFTDFFVLIGENYEENNSLDSAFERASGNSNLRGPGSGRCPGGRNRPV